MGSASQEPPLPAKCGAAGPRTPDLIPNYDLVQYIHRGGFGDVWLARERVTGVRRAVKLLFKTDSQRAARDLEGVRRYQQCAHNHPHLLQILTVGETERCYYYVMEAADAVDDAAPQYCARTLRTQMTEGGPLPAAGALEIVRRIASAVQRLHAQGLAHCDLKPENVLIVQGEPKVADVGLVSALEAAAPAYGTPPYMSPQGRADDLFALGRILYELMSGRPAAEFPTLPPALLDVWRPELTAAIQLVNRACDPEPERRFRSADEFLAAVDESLTARMSWARRWRRLSARSRVGLIAASVLVLSLVAFGSTWAYRQLVPVRLYEQDLPLRSGEALRLHAPSPAPRAHAYIHIDGRPLPRAGTYEYLLDRPLNYFVVDFHLRFLRPWGTLALHCCGRDDQPFVPVAGLVGQPDGRGLFTVLWPSSDKDTARIGKPILGHPQPGVEYVLRLARCGNELALVLRPLIPNAAPYHSQRAAWTPDLLSIERILLEGATDDALARVDLLAIRVAEYSTPLKDPTACAAPFRATCPLYIPPLPDNAPAPRGDILAGSFHPYETDAWMSVGNWSWWTGASPDAAPKVIRCTPFSSAERARWASDPEVVGGLQCLRFDRGRYGDFVATAHVRLADPLDPQTENRDPFPTDSHGGGIGLLFRLQDDAPPGAAMGAGYRAGLNFERAPASQSALPVTAYISRFDSLVFQRVGENLDGLASSRERPVAHVRTTLPRELLYSPDGFRFAVRAEGRHIAVYLGEQVQPIVEGDDDRAASLPAGRMAIWTHRFIAILDALVIE